MKVQLKVLKHKYQLLKFIESYKYKNKKGKSSTHNSYDTEYIFEILKIYVTGKKVRTNLN